MTTRTTQHIPGAVKKIRKDMLGMSGQQFGEEFGVTRTAVSQWELGTSAPSPAQLVQMATMAGVSVQWIITGEDSAGLNEDEGVLVRCFRGMTDEHRQKLLRVAWGFFFEAQDATA